MTENVVRQTALGKRYRSAGGPLTRRQPRVCDDLVATWIRVVAVDFSDAELADEFRIGRDMIKRIRCGISYTWLDEVLPRVLRRERPG